MSWLFGNNEFNEHIEKATSEMIPSGQEDISLFLEICDRIRSKEVPAKEAMRCLKKRLLHKNPNVQLLTLKLTDVCVKNGGPLFLGEIASREFMDTLVQIVNNNSTNIEVKNKILSHVQAWSNAFRAKPNLSYAVDTYNSLKSQGHQFPFNNEKTDAIMIDTQTAPEWTDSDVCERCRSLFTLTNRKHHCRNCGKTFCHQCSRNNVTLPHFGINNEVRVCDGCFSRLSGGPTYEPPTPVADQRSTSLQPSQNSNPNKEEEELQRAIALSILEAEKNQQKQTSKKSGKQKAAETDEESDPELAAAIAASLKEVKIKEEKKAASVYPQSHVSSSSKSPEREPTIPAQQYNQPVVNKNGVSTSDVQNIQLFHQLMDKMDADPTGASSAGLLQDRELKVLHESMTSLHSKLVKEIEECVEKHRMLMDLHEKLTLGVRVYDRLYEEKLIQQRQQQAAMSAQQHASVYSQYPPASGMYGYVQPQPQPYYHPQPYYNPSPPQQPASASSTPPPAAIPQGYYAPPPQNAAPVAYPYGPPANSQQQPAAYAQPPQQAPQPQSQEQQKLAEQKPLIEF